MKEFLLNVKMHRILLVILVIILLTKCYSLYVNMNRANSTITALYEENKKYKLKSGQNVVSQQVAMLTERQLKNEMKQDSIMTEFIKEFSKLKSVKTASIKFELPKTSVAFDKPITVADIDTITNELRFERTGAKFDKWFEFGYKVNQDSLSIEPFNTWTDVKIVDGFKRKWFLGKETYTSDILFTNPHLEAYQVKAYEVAIPKRFYDTRLFNIALGFGLSELKNSIVK